MYKPVPLSGMLTSFRAPHPYPKAVQNSKALHRRSIQMSLGSLVMQICCNTCAVAPQGCSQGTFLWKEPEKGTESWLLRGQSCCFFHHQHDSAQKFLKSLQSSSLNSFRIKAKMQFLFVNGYFQHKGSRTDTNIGKNILHQGAEQDVQDLQLQPLFPQTCRNYFILFLSQKLTEISMDLLFKKNNKKQYSWQRKIR